MPVKIKGISTSLKRLRFKFNVELFFLFIFIAIIGYMGWNSSSVQGASVTISGTVYDTDGSTPLTSQPAMKLVVGGTAYTTTAAVNGTFSFSSVTVTTASSLITIWLNTNGGDQASYVITWGSFCTGYQNCTGLSLVKNQVIVDSRNTAFITNSDLSSCDNDSGGDCSDTDIGFTSNSGALTLTWSTNEFKIASLSEFRPGGNVTAQKLELVGTYTGASETLTLTGSGTSTSCTSASQMPICVDDGTYDPVDGTINFTSTGNTNIPNAITYKHVGVGTSADSSAVTYTLNGNTTINGRLTVGNPASTATDALVAGSATLTLGGSSTTLNITSKGSFSAGTSTVVYSGNTPTVGAASYYNLTTDAASDFTRDGTAQSNGYEWISTGVIDANNGFVYYVTTPVEGAGQIIKVRMSDNSLIEHIEIPFRLNYDSYTAVIDDTNGFIYIADSTSTATSPVQVMKFSTRTFSYVDTLTLNNGENNLDSGAIDIANGFAYFATNKTTGPDVVKINLSTFTRTGSASFGAGETSPRGAAIDTTNGKLYFVTNQSPTRLVKFDLATFTRDSAVTLTSGENGGQHIVLDVPNQFAYITGTGRWISKVNISTMTEDSAVTLGTTEGPRNLVIDQPNGKLYVSEETGNDNIVRVGLSPFAREASASLDTSSGYYDIESMHIDQPNGKVYAGTESFPSSILKLDISGFSFDNKTRLLPEGDNFPAGTLDRTRGYIYFPAAYEADPPMFVLKYSIKDNAFVDKIFLNSGDATVQRDAVLDEANGMLYISDNATPANIIKVDIANNTRIGSITLSAGEGQIYAMEIDPVNNYLYAIADSNPGKIVKIDLSSFTRVDVLTLDTGENDSDAAAIDTTNGFLYVGNYTSPGQVVKINLNTFTKVGTLTFNSGENSIFSAAIDVEDGYAYFSNDLSPARIVKVNLNTFTRDSAVTLNSGESFIGSNGLALDPDGDILYVSTMTSPGRMVKVNASTMSRIGAITADNCSTTNTCENNLQIAIFNPDTGYVYFSENNQYSSVIRVKAGDIANFASASSQTVAVTGTFDMQGDGRGNDGNATITLSNDFSILSSKKFRSTSGTLNVGGNFSNSGTFTHNSGTVNITGSGTTTVSSTASMSFYNFTSSAAGKTIAFQSSGNPIFTFANTFNLNGTSGNNINVQSATSASQWTALFSSAQTSSYLSVTDSGCDPSSQNISVSNGTSVSNNDSCWSFAAATPTPTPGSGGVGGSGHPSWNDPIYNPITTAPVPGFTPISSGPKKTITPSPTPRIIPIPPIAQKPGSKPTIPPGLAKTPKPSISPSPTLTPAPTPTACTDTDKKVITKKIKESYRFSKKQIMAQFHRMMRGAFDEFKYSRAESQKNADKSLRKQTSSLATAIFNAAKRLAIEFKKKDYQTAKNIRNEALERVKNNCELPFPIPGPVPPSTPAPAPTNTPAPGPTLSPAPSPTISATPTPDLSQTPVPSVGISPGPTLTRTPSPSVTNTVSPIPSLSISPSATPSTVPAPTSTASPTPAAVPTPSTSSSPTPSVSVIPTVNPVPSQSVVPSPSITPTPLTSPVSSPVISVSPTVIPSVSPSVIPLPSLGPTASPPVTPAGVSPATYPVIEWYPGGGEYTDTIVDRVFALFTDSKFDTESFTYEKYIQYGPADVQVNIDDAQLFVEANPPVKTALITTDTAYVAILVPAIGVTQQTISLSTSLTTRTELWLILYQQMLSALGVLTFRKRKNFWGTVYDFESKQPLAPTLVNLIDADTGKTLRRTVTNVWGKFGFLVNPGRFKLKAEKTNYIFPSQTRLINDGFYDNLYFGQPIIIEKTSGLVLPNIPMDPVIEMKNMTALTSKLKYMFRVLLNIIFWSGFIFSISVFAASPGWINAAICFIYLTTAIIGLLRRKPRLWGRVKDKKGRNLGGLEVMLSIRSSVDVNIIIARTVTNQRDGKFFLKATPGSYILNISDIYGQIIYTGTAIVGKHGVLNKDIVLG